MKISEQWLREWVNPDISTQQLADKLTGLGLEVEAIHPASGDFTAVIVAEVVAVVRHPEADRLNICTVNIGNAEPLTVVCGASNVRANLKVALACVGAQLPGGLEIKEAKLRGQLSQGMLCSLKELGLAAQSEGILELPDDAPVGVNLRTYMQLDDQILTLNLTPNRADCLSIQGVARELAVVSQEKIIPPLALDFDNVLRDKLAANNLDMSINFDINIEEPKACPRYTGRVIKGISTTAKTPLWMQEKLRRVGLRQIHPVVDITNYVMWELGQPMHAFDISKINGSICVRYSKPNESLILLDGQHLKLADAALVIADAQKPLALAGIMGGAESGVTAETTDIFLESAYFDPILLSGTARKHRLCTDSSQRFERGVDPTLQLIALNRATDLIQTILGGNVCAIEERVSHENCPKSKVISFQPEHVLRLTGVDLPEAMMVQSLEGLGIHILEKSIHEWRLQVPLYRFDIYHSMDVVEELVRIEGYDKIPSASTALALQTGSINNTDILLRKSTEFFAHKGFNESINYSFVDPEIQSVLYPMYDALNLINPISSELSQMRVSLLPGLLASAMYNLNRQQVSLRLFETGVVFHASNNNEIFERPCISGIMAGQKNFLSWNEPSVKYDFFDLKGILQSYFNYFGLNHVSYDLQEHTVLHTGQSAIITADGKTVGWLGKLHPQWAKELDLDEDIFVFELYVDNLLVNNKSDINSATKCYYKPLSKFPFIRRDLSFIVSNSVTGSQIERVVRGSVDNALLKSFDIFDVYLGDLSLDGKKSIAISLCLQALDHTLVDSEIHEIMNSVIGALKLELDIILREST